MRFFSSADLPDDLEARLRVVGDVVRAEPGAGVRGDAFARAAPEVEGLITLLNDRVDAALLAQTPKLRVVANAAVGVDNIDLDACHARGLSVTNTPGVLTESSADLAFALLLAAARRLGEADRYVRSGAFTGWSPSLLVGAKVHGGTLGLIGLGRIGQAVARRARGFGMPVLYTQRTRLEPAREGALGVSFVALDELLTRSDFVSLHCPLTPETRHLLSRERLARMKRGSVLVNTARGACIDEGALADALRDGPLAAAGLDVFEEEPNVHAALLARENVVLAPHIGSADGPTRRAILERAVDNLIAEARGERAPNRVV